MRIVAGADNLAKNVMYTSLDCRQCAAFILFSGLREQKDSSMNSAQL